MARSLIGSLFDLLLPATCIGCAMRCAHPPLAGVAICAGCLASLRRPQARCAVCAHESASRYCARCHAAPPSFDRTIVLADYRAPLDRTIHALKYRAELSIARSLGTRLARRLEALEAFEPLADENPVLTAVPLAPARLRERGFNQALEIARSFGRVRGLRTDAAAIRRTRSGLPQAQLGPGSRRTNIAGAFEATPSRVAGRAIWVVDDVITTSATLHSVALALKHAGARSVTNLVIARTPMDHPNDHVQRRSRST